MNNIMAQVGEKLNLKEHVVKDVSIYGPADIGFESTMHFIKHV
jgi:hypothetical protein